MAAFVAVQLRLCGLPAGIPNSASIFNIDVLAVGIPGHVVIAVPGHAQQLCILIEGIAAAGVGNKAVKAIAAQVIDPGQRGLGSRDHVLLSCVVKITEFHSNLRQIIVLVKLYITYMKIATGKGTAVYLFYEKNTEKTRINRQIANI